MGKIILGILIFLFANSLWAKVYSQGDMLNAQSYLERLIERRYTRMLSTRVSQGEFQVSSNLQLSKVKAKKPQELEPLSDLNLSYLNPEKLYRNYSGMDEFTRSLLADFVVKRVDISLGLKSQLGEETVKEISQWFAGLVKTEFGKIARSSVHTIKGPEKVSSPKKNWLDKLKDYQNLVGLLLLGFALLGGVLLWKILSAFGSRKKSEGLNINNKLDVNGNPLGAGGSDGNSTLKMAEEMSLVEKLDRIKTQVLEVLPQLTEELRSIIREWCQSGPEGILLVSVLAELGGKDLGPLPIPDQFRDRVFTGFKDLQKMELKDKVEIVQQVYWDLLATLNLGSETLHKPFSFVGGVSIDAVSDVLMKSNIKMQTIVSLYMSSQQREEFMESLDSEGKVELLKSAASLDEIKEKELLELENELAPNFEVKTLEKSVPLSMSLGRIIASMKQREMCELLKGVAGPVLEDYKRENPAVAFLDEWPEDRLAILLKVATNDQVLAYLRAEPSMHEKVLKLVPPLTKAILSDDLQKVDSMDEKTSEQELLGLLGQMRNLIALGEVDLKSIFKKSVQEVKLESAA